MHMRPPPAPPARVHGEGVALNHYCCCAALFNVRWCCLYVRLNLCVAASVGVDGRYSMYEKKILKELQKSPVLTDDAFRAPVAVLYPELWAQTGPQSYRSLIETPMDLRTVAERLEAGAYAGYPRGRAVCHHCHSPFLGSHC